MNVLESSTKIAFKNILFLTDFSEASQTAMQYAAMLAKHYGATFYPAHVETPTPPMYMEGYALTEYFNVVEDQTRKRLTELVEPLGVSPHVLVGEGLIEYAIERWTAIHGIDLIVIGTHGWRGLQRVLLGSTAELILRGASCPVLTVGPHVSQLERNPEYIDHVLFATDLTEQTEYAVSYALSFAHERCAYSDTPACNGEGLECARSQTGGSLLREGTSSPGAVRRRLVVRSKIRGDGRGSC